MKTCEDEVRYSLCCAAQVVWEDAEYHGGYVCVGCWEPCLIVHKRDRRFVAGDKIEIGMIAPEEQHHYIGLRLTVQSMMGGSHPAHGTVVARCQHRKYHHFYISSGLLYSDTPF